MREAQESTVRAGPRDSCAWAISSHAGRVSALSSSDSLLFAGPLPPFLSGPLRDTYVCHDYFHADAAERARLLAEVGSSVRAVVVNGGTLVPTALLDALPAVKIVSVFGVGYDGVPIPYCRERGIQVTNTPDVLTDDVADVAVALVLMTARKLVEANRFIHSGAWSERPFELAWKVGGKRAGIFGLGRIGKAIARRLAAHDMEIAYHGRQQQSGVDYPYFGSLAELAQWSDFLIVAAPGGTGTQHAINAEILAALGAKGTLINIARGSVVDETALVEALKSGGIRGAGLDVFDHEPNVEPALLAAPNTVLLPHLGSGTHETRQAMADLVLRNLEAHFHDRPLLTAV